MLPQSFFDWWFMPWAYALNGPIGLPLAADQLGQRDGYRLWCKHTGVAADFPSHFAPAWHIAATTQPKELVAAARLFGGLIAVRQNDEALLGQLTPDEKKWCGSIAATQPLRACSNVPYEPGDSIDVHGLLELARRLETNFAGVWSRLRLLLPSEQATRVDTLLDTVSTDENNTEVSAARAQRCWAICRNRAVTQNVGVSTADVQPDEDTGKPVEDNTAAMG